jgi:hypothetical protein
VGRKKSRARPKSRSTAPRLLASWSHDTALEGMASCLHAMVPWLLVPWTLTGFSRATAELTCQDTAPARVASCYVPTVPRRLAPCIGPIFGILSPRGLYVKILRKKDQNAKILLPTSSNASTNATHLNNSFKAYSYEIPVSSTLSSC